MSQHNGRVAKDIILKRSKNKHVVSVGGELVKICGVVLFQRDQSRFDTFLTNASNAFCKM